MTNEEKKKMMAEAMKEIEAAYDSGNMAEMYTMFIEALKEFDTDKAVDSLVLMYDMFTPETYASLGVFFSDVSNSFERRMFYIDDPDKLEKAERIAEIMEEMMEDEES